MSNFFNTKSAKFWIWVAMFKLFMAFNTRSRYHADENQQSVEVAYQFLYREVHLAWEWDPKYTLRSTLHPLIYAVMFYIVDLLHLNFDWVLYYLPNIFHALLSLVADWYFIKIFEIERIQNKKSERKDKLQAILPTGDPGNNIAVVALLIYYTSWYSGLLMVKTFSNSVEAALNILILYKWLKIKQDNKIVDVDAIVLTTLITISFIMRNTSIVPWLIPMMYKVFVQRTLLKFLFCGFFIAIPIMIISILWDSYYYGEFTLTFYSFLKFNVLSGQSNYFGVNSPFNYLLAYPITQMTTLYPFFIFGIIQNLIWHVKQRSFPLLNIMFWSYIIVLSLIGHKENRFMLPLFQIWWIFTATSIASLLEYKSAIWKTQHELITKRYQIIPKVVKAAIILRILFSLIIWLHLSQFSDLMYKTNDYVKSLEPSDSIFLYHEFESRTTIDYNYKYDSSSKILVFPCEPHFSERNNEYRMKISFLAKQYNEIYNYLPYLSKMETLPSTIVIQDSISSIQSRKTKAFLASKGYILHKVMFNRIIDNQPRSGPKSNALMYSHIYVKKA